MTTMIADLYSDLNFPNPYISQVIQLGKCMMHNDHCA